MASSPAGPAQTMLNTVVLVFTLLAGLIVFLRLFTRGLLVHKAGAEDVWISFAMVLSIGLTVAIALQISNGLGMHIQDLSPAMMLNSQKAFWASIWIYNLALTATKISILTQYLRVFPIPQFRTACFVVMGVVAIYGLWTLVGSIFLCYPVAFFWDKTIANGKCLNREAIWFSNASVNIAQDVVILVLPMIVLKSLDIPSKQKRALIVVFGLGGLVCLVSIIRLRTLVSVANSTDPTFDNPPAAMLSAIETNVGIICACLPSMRPLLASMMPMYFSGGSQYLSTHWQYDAEQPRHMHMRKPSSNSRPATVDSFTKSYVHSRSNSRTFRSGSVGTLYNPTSPPRSHSRTGSRSPHSPIPSYSSRSNSRTANRNVSTVSRMGREAIQKTTPTQQLTSTPLNDSNGHHHHPVNPLQMSPFSPLVPSLPKLPENMAVLGSLNPKTGFQERPIRMPLFHKPLPITPFPGHQHELGDLSKARDQTLSPKQLSPGLLPPPLNLGSKSPQLSN